jgi:glycosyltransferase involved in cell wall biosynthesis
LRVLYSYPYILGSPGTGTTAYHQVAGLIELGADVSVFCTSLARDVPGARRVVTTMSVAGRRVPHRALGIDRAYRYHDARVARALRRLAKEIDVAHVWPRATIQTAKAAAAAGVTSVREVPNTHTAYAYEAVARELELLGLDSVPGHSHTFDPKVLALEESEYEAVDRLLVPSEFSLRTFVERGIPSERLVLHQYGFDPGRFEPGNGDRPASRGLTTLFVGRCEPRKGLHHALQAWIDSGAAERGRFLICGDFFPGYRELLEPLLAHPSVEVLGFVSDVAELMRGSDALLLPSIEEGSALVTYEAQGCGCVLVVSEASGARCEHMRHGLVHEAGDVVTLTEHLRILDRDPGLRSRLRAATLAHRDQLTWAAAARGLRDVHAALGAARLG